MNASLFLMCLINYSNLFHTFIRQYVNFICAMAIGGCIIFGLVMVTGLEPLIEYVNADTRPGFCYLLTCTNTKIGDFIRYSGFFDEPGSMAFWGMYAIILNRLTAANIKIENILLSSIAFTFSLAYFIQLAFFLFWFKIRSFKKALIFVIIIVTVIIGIKALEKTDYNIIYRMSIGRMELADDGTLAGDNRSNLMDNAVKVFEQYPVLGIGATNFSNLKNYSGDNPIAPLSMDGIIGFIFLYLPFIYSLKFCIGNRIYIGCWIILCLGYLQRPFTCFYIYFVTLYIFTLLGYYASNKSKCYSY